MFPDLFFQRGAIGTLLAKSRRNHHRGFHSRIDTLANNLRNGVTRRDDNRQVHSSRNVADALVRLDAENFIVPGIHRINFDGILALQKI